MTDLTRRDFARMLALTATMPAHRAVMGGHRRSGPVGQSGSRDEAYWAEVRGQFLFPVELAPMNAANLCPAPRPVVESVERWSRALDSDPSPTTREKLPVAREESRRLVAEFLGVTPDEIVLTRNTSESNNLVSSGLTLKPGDEVVTFADNHPSALRAWQLKAERMAFTVVVVPQVNPHPGPDHYLDAFARAITPRTRVLAFSHVSNTVGDLLPAAALCALARERGVLTLVDGAQSFGVLDVRPAELGADFYTGSAHKWLCGPREVGILYVGAKAQERLAPSIISLYPGRVGASRTLEAFGQRDEPALAALGDAVTFQTAIGRERIEQRARALAQALMEGLAALPDVTLWTHPAPDRSAAVVSFRPGTLDPRRLATALHQRDGIVCATRGGEDRPGIRLSPHLYNLSGEVEHAVDAIGRYLRNGV
jgi:selenocysteine lyase/cysteine desulfurase